jgi:hypothetical protein
MDNTHTCLIISKAACDAAPERTHMVEAYITMPAETSISQKQHNNINQQLITGGRKHFDTTL